MSGRGDTYRYEPPRTLRDFFGEVRAALGAREQPQFTGLRAPLSCLVPGDPAIALDLYRGRFAFAGKTIEGQPGQILSRSPDQIYRAEILSLGWLPHLAAAEFSLYRAFARNLYSLCTDHGDMPANVRCRRIMTLSRHADFLLADAPADFGGRFFSSLSREVRALSRLSPRTAPERLCQALALLAAALAFRGGENLRDQALENAAASIPAVIMADGGHVSRNPKLLLDLLLDLLPVQEALQGRRVTVPAPLSSAVERALPMLRMMCHGDGGLALFQGADNLSTAAVAAVFDCDPVQGRPLTHAPHSGYVRLDQGRTSVIMDAGEAVSCHSALAFEFSQGQHRVVTNCGLPEFASPAWRNAAQSAAAHSGLQLERAGRQELPSFLGRWLRRPSPSFVQAEVVETPDGVLAKATNKSHEASHGIVHHREIFLAASGHSLDGEDRFAPSPRLAETGGGCFTLRFHIDPQVKAFSERNGARIMLLLPNREVWQFTARGGKAELEDSVRLAGPDGIRNSQQIVIRGVTERPDSINWSFRRLEKPSRQGGQAADDPQLPF